VGGFAIIAITAVYLLMRSGAPTVLAEASPAFNTALALLAFWLYSFGASVFFGQSDVGLLFKACSEGLGISVSFLLLALNGDLVKRTFSVFARLNALLGFSIATTWVLIPLVGYSGLRLLSYSIGGYEGSQEGGNGDILFPFSVVYSTLTEYGIYRFCGIYREAGIAQAFFVWSAIYLMYARAGKFWIIGTMLGALLCGSTAVVFSIAGATMVHFGSRSARHPKELLLLIALLATLTLVAIFAPGLGLIDKLQSHSTSVSDRQVAMEMALPGPDIWRWLVGHGMFFSGVVENDNIGINAISGIFSVGVFGFLLYLATFFAGMFRAPSWTEAFRYLTLVSPLLVTSLFFQPVMDAPLVMGMLFIFPVPARAALAANDTR
jgi:hypothetical protein